MLCINCGNDSNEKHIGVLINRAAWLGSQIVSAKERLVALEKLAKKTPAKTLVAEVLKVKQAILSLVTMKASIEEMEKELAALKPLVGWTG